MIFIINYILMLISLTLTSSFILWTIEYLFHVKFGLIPFFIAGFISGIITPLLVKKDD